jgi:hypothetical protein
MHFQLLEIWEVYLDAWFQFFIFYFLFFIFERDKCKIRFCG